MLLSSPVYFVFLAGIFLLYWSAARWRTLTLAVVLFANYFFYARWDLLYLFLVPAASSCDFLIARALEIAQRAWLRRLLVAMSLMVNLGILISLKYMPFALENYARLAGTAAPLWRWLYPLRLSFYAFQALTYTIDVYRRDVRASSSYLAYLAAVSFFPTTLAGPITRVAVLLPQLNRKQRALEEPAGGHALFLIGLGLTKKLLIADYLGTNLVDRVFDFPNLYSGLEVLAGVYAYALQIYYDFSGYTDIAIGSALLLGIQLPENFRRPYAATSIPDFWRRWHITLSTWLRDYLYFSLPGLRSKYKAFTYLNLLVTMLLGGLWHGASWNFAVWGLLHGAGLALSRAWQSWRGNPRPGAHWATQTIKAILTAQFVAFAWIFFRAPDLSGAAAVLARIASGTVSSANLSTPLVAVFMAALSAHYIPRGWFDRVREAYAAAPSYAQAAALFLLALSLRHLAGAGAAPFIYTRF